jgi:hypothetical protein
MKKINWNKIIWIMTILGFIEITITAIFDKELSKFEWYSEWQIFSYICFGVFLLILFYRRRNK